jgi:small-conductance mechanosensitive channel
MLFGDSTLNFELRIYVNQLRERLLVGSQLHCEIMRRFRELNIEIAFPQLDLHVRDMAPFETMTQQNVPAHQASGRKRTRVKDKIKNARDDEGAGEVQPPESDR